MANPVRRLNSSLLVVAAYREDTDWTADVPDGWDVWVIRKAVDLPNVGREGATFAYALATAPAYERYGFVQGHPFDHCPDILDRLDSYQDGFKWLGEANHTSDGQGRPHDDVDVAAYHQRFAGSPFPEGTVRFAPGGQFCVDHQLRRSRSAGAWRRLQAAAAEDRAAWAIERLWEAIFQGHEDQRFPEASAEGANGSRPSAASSTKGST